MKIYERSTDDAIKFWSDKDHKKWVVTTVTERKGKTRPVFSTFFVVAKSPTRAAKCAARLSHDRNIRAAHCRLFDHNEAFDVDTPLIEANAMTNGTRPTLITESATSYDPPPNPRKVRWNEMTPRPRKGE